MIIYEQICVLCHGISGNGNGEAGLSLEKKPSNFLALKISQIKQMVKYSRK